MDTDKWEDLIGWRLEDGTIVCASCGRRVDRGAKALTKDDFISDQMIVYCDRCNRCIIG